MIRCITFFTTSNFIVPVIYLYPDLAAFYPILAVKYSIYSIGFQKVQYYHPWLLNCSFIYFY